MNFFGCFVRTLWLVDAVSKPNTINFLGKCRCCEQGEMKNKHEAPSWKGPKGSKVNSHDGDSCEKDGDGRHRSASAAAVCGWVHRVAVVCVTPGHGGAEGKHAENITHQDWSARPVRTKSPTSILSTS